MELRSLSQKNVLVKDSNGFVLIVPQPSQINSTLAQHKDVKIVITFAESKSKVSNREVLICDWPGEYERNDTSIIGIHLGCFVVAWEGKHWLVATDTALKSIDHDNEHLGNVEGLIVWVTGSLSKSEIQDAIARLAVSYVVYCTESANEPLVKELTPPPLESVSELTIKPSELDSAGDQIKAQALLV